MALVAFGGCVRAARAAEARMSYRPESVPRRREGADGQRFGADFVVLDAEGRTLRGLNDTAARVWELSDGKRTAREIAAVMAHEYGVDV